MTQPDPMTPTDTIARVLPVEIAQRAPAPQPARGDAVFEIEGLTVQYGRTLALHDVNLDIYRNMVTAIIGPSGCGKSTFIRCLNRMNDLVPGARIEGRVNYQGVDLYG
ncbi:MAG: phosphate transport system ATP-binding protein, partial [Gaiellaceae bacterium]|nr:phosphate transport system ATP-binding protein [Gaiellaceae bacterium]